jgi:hypothetical protein
MEAQVKAGIAPAWVKRNLVERPPVLFEPWMIFYWQAWNALRYDRRHLTIGTVSIEQPILFSAIDTYARRHEIDGALFDNLLRFVSTIDLTYLNIRAEDRARQNPSR